MKQDSKVKLCLQDISKIFSTPAGKNVEVLKDINFYVDKNELVAIVGPSGCGKTTLLKIIAGLTRPTTGKVILNGKVTTGPSMEKGLVFQNPVSFPWLTVIENVEFGMKLKQIDERERIKQANYYLDLVGLSDFDSYYINKLSGGMKQRVALATVLANDPDILLMDEPFSALDTQTRALMQELILTIWGKTKKTILFVTHDIEEAIFLADRVYVMSSRPGQIKEEVIIDLPRQRTSDVKFSKKFIDIKKHITYIIRSETIKAAQIRPERLSKPTLKIGIFSWPGNIPFYLAEELGLYEKYNLNVEFVNMEKNREKRFDLMRNDEIDLLNITIDQTVITKSEGLNVQVFICLNSSAGGDVLIAQPNIHSIEDLKNKTIAVEKKWISHGFLLYILDKHGMTEKDIKVKHIHGSDIGAALITKEVDAAILWDPWLSQITGFGNYNILASTKEDPVIIDVLVAKKQILAEKKDYIKVLIQIWYEAMNYMINNRDKLDKFMTISFPFGLSLPDLYQQLQRVHFITAKENKNIFTGKSKKSLPALLNEYSRIFKENNIIPQEISGDELINYDFIDT